MTPQPPPAPNDQPSIHDLVRADIVRSNGPRDGITYLLEQALEERKQFGLKKYGTILQAHNGRNHTQDCFEEILDGLCYAKQAMVENPNDVAMRQVYQKLQEIAMQLVLIATVREARRNPAVLASQP